MKLLHFALATVCVACLSCDRKNDKIPIADLNDGGRVEWIDPNSIQPGPIRREVLTEEQMSRIKALQAVFVEVDGQTVDQWVDNFKRDMDPDSELEVWEQMAKAFRSYCDGRILSETAKEDVYRVVLMRSMAPQNEVLGHVKLIELSRDEAIEVMKRF